ncbi:D-tyrosyl-tRNA(Tyr) deacylase [Propionibacterium cyclohexanicum]|uniref:D-aminoacyl-tRNA deacylase n=1 Tax=Propionibacterium cyclohexanicum TaxID=64702 RepID=A0A1H9RSW5_9ACTN|nr:D-aminoacyl-tRNA deacylase [Propionibacterium cyclohexanicum]SER75930.1 D-tyrosyl-tRNA(Tyr) deacylase [Propionibacterium cyclohexanicum]
MRVLLQRAARAEVSIDGQVVGSLPAEGLVALVGVTHGDDIATAHKLAAKTWTLRILDGERSAADLGAPILAISQFTLYADTHKGRRPSWSAAAPSPISEPIVDAYVEGLRALGAHVETGRFGATMQVSLVNDGPLTILLESER